MIVCVNGEGQGCCMICLHTKGFHREWSSSLYYIKNANGVFLRTAPYGDSFVDDSEIRRSVFCYEHAKMVDEIRQTQPGYFDIFPED